jgi:hypothetical protein
MELAVTLASGWVIRGSAGANVSIWDAGWPDQPEAEREGDWDEKVVAETGDKTGDKWKPNRRRRRAGGCRIQDVQEAAERMGGGVRNGNER